MPLTMKIWFSAPIAPRMRLGASSDMYVGTVAEERPMPRPRTVRKATSVPKFGASAQATVATMTTPPATMMVRRRPTRPVSRAARPAPTIAPTERLAVRTPFPKPSRFQALEITTRMPLMMPRS